LRTPYRIALAACAVVALLSATEEYFWGQVTGRGFGFARSLVLDGSGWIAFAAIAPALARRGVRFRLEWPPRGPAIVAHLGGIAATLTLLALVGTITRQWLGDDAQPGSFWEHLRNTWIFQSPLAVITYGATVGIGYVAEASRRARELERLQAELTRAQLDALRMQLNPHFLFNTLHTIAAQVREHDERGAVEMIERLGDVLRHVLRTSNEHETPLASEIEFLQNYLGIEQARFGDRLVVAFAIDDDVAHVLVPQLIIQPLVENALRHGLAARDAPGTLTVAGQRLGSAIELCVRDNGAGLRDGWDDGSGVGVANVRARLSRMYGPSAGLDIAGRPGGGVVATIRMPYRERRDG
jgi:two-component system LytT family sensor kinase